MIPKEKEDGNYEGRKKSDRKTLAATAFAEELKNVPESFFFMLQVAPELPFTYIPYAT